jgi:hypothetical protein
LVGNHRIGNISYRTAADDMEIYVDHDAPTSTGSVLLGIIFFRVSAAVTEITLGFRYSLRVMGLFHMLSVRRQRQAVEILVRLPCSVLRIRVQRWLYSDAKKHQSECKKPLKWLQAHEIYSLSVISLKVGI